MEAPDFFVEDLLDLSHGGDDVMTDAFFDSVAGNSTDSSTLTPAGADTCNSFSAASRLSFPNHFSDDLCVPCDDLAELEWLSNFVEDSFSSEDLHKFHLIPMSQQPIEEAQFHNMGRQPNPNPPSSTVRAKARSKRSRVAPCDWSTRLLMVAAAAPTSPTTSSSDPNPRPGLAQKKSSSKRRDNGGSSDSLTGEVRRCLHCASEKTPQWRTGPMGPKTLCNACGVRYKSGRLVPEYRPASSPTFVSTKHSNSHRKVVELRRQKEVQHQVMGHQPHHHDQGLLMNASNGGNDYLIHHQLSPDYRRMI